ncbi:MAG: nucleotidyltransferase family protein [Thalassospira sp.]|uniref:nucleotidyltransferase family protein n=1 Tax=Thalassospira sp. TaxID=1912094 RepID=UPI003A83F4F0
MTTRTDIPNPKLATLLLAAGESARFGGRKQLADINGKPMIHHALDALSHLPLPDIFVVLGAYGDQIAPVLGKEITIITNDNWATGMGSSIARGMKAVMTNGGYDGVLIALCDQINLTDEDYNQLIAAFDGTQIVATRHADGLGVPAIFPKASFDDLLSLSGQIGARKIINSHKGNLVAIDLPNAALDIDTRDDLAKVIHQPA